MIAAGLPHAMPSSGAGRVRRESRRRRARPGSRTTTAGSSRPIVPRIRGTAVRSASVPAVDRGTADVRCRPDLERSDLEDTLKLTGERPMQGATPDSLLALHDAGYREVLARLGPGVVVDVGCGIGDETERLAAARPLRGRRRLQRRRRSSRGEDLLHEPRRLADGCASLASDGARLGLRDRSVDYVVLVAHHRALRRIRRCTSPSSLGCFAARRHRVRDHAERAGRLREPVPRVPVRAQTTSCRCCSCSSTKSRASASKATRCSRPTSRRGARAATGC